MKIKAVLAIISIIFTLFHLKAQERLITGKITDIKGNSLGGVTVAAKDYPALTTISGVDGEFRIEVFDFTKTLIFSFSNMKTKEVTLGDLNRLLVEMEFMPMKNPNPWSIMLNLHSGRSDVYNKAKDENQDWDYSSEPGFMASLEMDYFITQNIGFGAGVGINHYTSSNFLNNFTNYGENTIERVDQDGDSYYLYNLSGTVNERIKIKTISFPVKLKFRFRQGKKWNYFADIGIKILNILSAKNEANGATEWQAYYPKYSAVLYDVPAYGFTNYTINSSNSLIDYEKLNLAFIASFGVSRRIKKEFNLDLGFFIDRGLNDLKYDQPVHPADFLNTIGIYDKTVLKAIGMMIGVRYHFTKKR